MNEIEKFLKDYNQGKDEAIANIEKGVTPRAMEKAIESKAIDSFCAAMDVRRVVFTRLAKRWGLFDSDRRLLTEERAAA